MKNLYAGLFTLFFLSACGGGSSSFVSVTTPERITITGAGDLGIFDPSLTRDPGTNRLWMSYSSVETSSYYDPSVYWAVSIRLASSDDNGVSWQDVGVVAPNVETTLGPMEPIASIPAGSDGIWQNEMSSIIYDPAAVPAERWKLIWVQYLHVGTTSFFADHSWITLKMAATPEGLTLAMPIKLFGGAGLRSDGSNTGYPVYSPTGGTPAIQLNTDLTPVVGGADTAELNLCIFAEPGLHATSNALYLATYCADASTVPATDYLVYFRCANSPCDITNAASWEYLGRLLTPTDALAATGDHHYQAPALVEKNGTTYLLATPVNTSSGNRYNGCRVYEFTDVNTNQLLRKGSGELTEIARIDGDADTHNGACAAFNGLSGGILYSQLEAASTMNKFNIYKSQVSLP